MHSPPPVSYPVGRSRAADGLLLAVLAAGVSWSGISTLLLAMQSLAGWRVLVPCMAVLLAALSSWRFREQAIQGTLALESGRCTLSSNKGTVVAIGHARICLDFQRLMLIHIEANGRWHGHCLWVDRQADRPRWHDLRRALYAANDVAESAAPGQGDEVVPA